MMEAARLSRGRRSIEVALALTLTLALELFSSSTSSHGHFPSREIKNAQAE